MEAGDPAPPLTDMNQAKYAKLAMEYAKLRAQFGVVKKALLDEQGQSQILSEKLREKEMRARKYETEMESVQFRNVQLTRRVHVLQEELEALDSMAKHAKDRGAQTKKASAERMAASEGLNSVIGRELQGKIEENAQLHARLAEIDHKYEEVISSLQSRIKQLEAGDRKQAQSERAEDSHRKDLIQGLKTENVQHLERIRALEKELIDCKDRITVLQVQLESASVTSEVASPVQTPAPKPSNSHVPLKTEAANNYPLRIEDVRIQSVELLSQFGESISDLVAGFSDFLTYWEHRLKDTHLDGPLTDSADQLSKLLLQNVKFLKPIEEAFQTGLSEVLARKSRDCSGILRHFQKLTACFSRYVSYVMELEPQMLACLQIESNAYSCPPGQRERNAQLQNRIRSFNRVLERVSHYMTELQKEQESEVVEAIENLTVAVSQLHQETTELYNIYSAKAVDENNLPTVTDQLKNTNQCIVASLSSIANGENSISRLLSDNMPRIITLIRVGSHFQGLPDSSPEEEQPPPSDQLQDLPDSNTMGLTQELELIQGEKDTLLKTIEDLQQKVKKAEETKEHWSLEFQLLQMKYDRCRTASGQESMLAETDQDKLFSERELELKSHFQDRMKEIVAEKLMADSQATAFYLECVALEKRYRAAEKRREHLMDELRKAEAQNEGLREEVGTTAASYEGQLSLMTEHVANMNEKLTLQTDEIESLKYELNHKGKKKK